jgi:hypothetical protein
MIVIMAIGGFLVLALVAFNLFGQGGDDASAPLPTTASSAPTVPGGSSGTTTTTQPGAPTVPSGSFDVFATKDPFQPVVDVGGTDTGGSGGATSVTNPPAGGSTGGGSASGGGTSGGGSPTGGSGSGSGSGSGTTPDTTPPDQNPSGGTAVALLDVFADGAATKAQVRVGSTVYTVSSGDVFATSYKAVSLSGTCGQFLYGDSPFQLCEGEEVIK